MDKVIVSSKSGEIRIEAFEQKGSVSFRTYFKNTVLSKLNHDGEPLEKLTRQGVGAYYIKVQREIKALLDEKMHDQSERILHEIEADMQPVN